MFVCCISSLTPHCAGANTDDTNEGQRLHKMCQRPTTGQHYLHHEYHHDPHHDHNQYHHQVTAREGKPILIIEEGDAETAAWAQHSLEVGDHPDFDSDGDDHHDGDCDNVIMILVIEKEFHGVDVG